MTETNEDELALLFYVEGDNIDLQSLPEKFVKTLSEDYYHCNFCDSKVKVDAKFCANCGKPTKNVAPVGFF